MQSDISLFGILSLIISVSGIIGIYVKLSGRVTSLEVKVDIFWKGITFDAAQILHKPHIEFKRRDELLEKYQSNEINKKELVELYNTLKDLINNEKIENAERLAASTIVRVIESNYLI